MTLADVSEIHLALRVIRLGQVLVVFFIGVLLDPLKEGHADQLLEDLPNELFGDLAAFLKFLVDTVTSEVGKL